MDARLRELTLEITRECMNRCMYCSSLAVRHSSTPPISHETVARLVQEAIDLGLHSLAISGGEPFVHPETAEILSTCRELEVPSLLVYTSGVTRDDRGGAIPLTGQMLGLAHACDARLIFNIESIEPAVHDFIVGAPSRLETALTSLRGALDRGMPVECHVVPNHQNVRSLARTARALVEMGVERVSFLRLVPQGYAAENRAEIVCTKADGREMAAQFRTLMADPKADSRYRFGVPFSGHCGKPKQCQAGISKLIMRWDGAFFPCEAFKECGREEFNLGYARDLALSTALANVQSCSELCLLKSRTSGQDTCPAQCLYT